MSYADSLLATGERILHRERQHWLVLVWGARLPIASIVAALLLIILSTNVTGVVGLAVVSSRSITSPATRRRRIR